MLPNPKPLMMKQRGSMVFIEKGQIDMFPTLVGLNRGEWSMKYLNQRVPHACGAKATGYLNLIFKPKL